MREAMERIGVFGSGLWRLREDLAVVTGGRPVRRVLSTRGLDATAGWGFKPTAARARAAARRAGIPYIAVEDGFLRSRAPGSGEPSSSYVVDRMGVYYDAGGPSDLEAAVLARARDPRGAERDAAPAFEAVRDRQLSKYNLFDPEDRRLARRLAEGGGHVLALDQVADDASVSGAGCGRPAFAAMLTAAAAENPDSRILVKTHPETLAGRRAGHVDAALLAELSRASPEADEAIRSGRLILVGLRAAPADLLGGARRVYAVSSLMGFEALLHGVAVTTFGRAFYAGWGVADDRAPSTGRRRNVPLACLVAAAYVDYSVYLSPDDRSRCDLARVADHLERMSRGR